MGTGVGSTTTAPGERALGDATLAREKRPIPQAPTAPPYVQKTTRLSVRMGTGGRKHERRRTERKIRRRKRCLPHLVQGTGVPLQYVRSHG
jgi:hypothetical protein